jgi:SAM-dependent methyltransferase
LLCYRRRVDDSLRDRAVTARAQLIAGSLRGTALVEALEALSFIDRDAWLDELLGIEPPPLDTDLPRGAVPYLPCGVAEILAMVREAPVGPGDVVVDIGAGLGRAAILAHLLSGARTVGIELQAGLVERARARCAALGLAAVSFVHGDAAEIALDGSVFFLYAPCNGELLARVLRRIEDVARCRRIVVCAVGFEPDTPWLHPRPASQSSLTLYDARAAYRAHDA